MDGRPASRTCIHEAADLRGALALRRSRITSRVMSRQTLQVAAWLVYVTWAGVSALM